MSQKLQSWTLPKEHISCGLHPEPYKSSPDHTKLGPPNWAQISQSGPAACQKAGGPWRCVGWSWLLSQLLWLVKLVWSEIENTHSLVGERHSATLEGLFHPREKKTPSQSCVLQEIQRWLVRASLHITRANRLPWEFFTMAIPLW